MRRRDDVISCDIQELEASLRQQEVVRDQETPAEEIARLKEASQADHLNVDREVKAQQLPVLLIRLRGLILSKVNYSGNVYESGIIKENDTVRWY